MHIVKAKLTKGQIMKIIHSEPVLIKHNQIGHGLDELHLHEHNHHHLGHLSHKKSVKLHLDDEEREHTLHGGSILSRIKKFGNTIKHGIQKVGKPIASDLIHYGIPGATSAIGDYLGGPVGGIAGNIAGAHIANAVGKKTGLGFKKGSIEAKEHMAKIRAMKKGKGLINNIKKFVHKHKDTIKKGIKSVTNHAIGKIADIAGEYSGQPKLVHSLADSLTNAVNKSIDNGNFKSGANHLRHDANVYLKDEVQRNIDKLPVGAQPYANKAAEHIGLGLKDSKMYEDIMHVNFRVKRKRGRPKKMGSGLDNSKLYKETMRDNFGINSDDLPDSNMMSMKKIKKPIIQAPTQNTFSPFANANSPAMNPYIPMYNPFLVPIPLGSTKPMPMYGSGLYYGGSMGHGLY
jgi:hypothetical protein